MHQIEWVFSGIGVLAVTLLYQFISRRKTNSKRKAMLLANPENNGPLKLNTRVLFVDHDANCRYAAMIINAGWISTKISADISNFDASDVFEAHGIFVNAEGVGAGFFYDQGYGLAVALKEKYPAKKIVIYGVDGRPDIFLKTARGVDAYIPKGAQAYDFVKLLEGFFN